MSATLVVRIPMQPAACLSPNARRGASHRARQPHVRALREAAALGFREAVLGGQSDAAARLRSAASVVVDWHVAWGKGQARKDDDAIPLMLKGARDQIAAELGLTSDRRVRTGKISQGRDAAGLGYVVATLREEDGEG